MMSNNLCRAKSIVVAMASTLLATPLYAAWYSCPSPENVAAGQYAPFVLCSGKTANAKRLNMVYTNVFKKNNTYWGACKYRYADNIGEVSLKVPLQGAADVLPASGWLGTGGVYVCGFEPSSFIGPEKNPQFNVK